MACPIITPGGGIIGAGFLQAIKDRRMLILQFTNRFQKIVETDARRFRGHRIIDIGGIRNPCSLFFELDVLFKVIMLAHQVLNHNIHIGGLAPDIFRTEAVKPQKALA
jgi:hypothetical protein